MNKKIITKVSLGVLLIAIVAALGLISRIAIAETKTPFIPDPCICSKEVLLTMSNGLQQKLEDISGKSFREGERFLNSVYGSIFNCVCGKSQCVVSSTTRGLNAVSCTKNGFFD